jgi:hypothetical protein
MSSPKRKRVGALLGLSIDAGRISGAVVRVSGSGLEVQNQFSAPLTLDPLTHEPELVGREIQNQLQAAGIRERHCSVCLPLSWALTLQTKASEVPEEDVASFLEIEAERGFPYALDALMISRSRFRAPAGELYVTQVAVPREHVTRLEAALKAARLTPLTFSLGVCALQRAESEASNGVIAIVLDDDGAGLQITSGGGVTSLRVLEGAFEAEGAEKRLDSDHIARDIRITLGQLPPGVGDTLRQVRVFGRPDLARQLSDELRTRLQSTGVRVEWVEGYAAKDFRLPLPSGTRASSAVSLAANSLNGLDALLEFLPPKISAWKQFSDRYASAKLAYAGVAAGAVVVLVAGAFGYQQYQLTTLGSQYAKMEPNVKALDDLQDQIRKYRPWYSPPVISLNILRDLTKAFPEDGSVTAKTVEIRQHSTIICMGTAQDNAALLKAIGELRKCKDVADVNIDTMQGKQPMQFTFSFHWGEGGSDDR